MPARALVFDFDGVIVDTETPEFTAWREVFEAHGATLTEADWAEAVGYVGNLNPRALLESRAVRPPDWDRVEPTRRARHLELVSRQPALPGVERLMWVARTEGWRIGVASNSSSDWVRSGLERVGLLGAVDAIRGRGEVDRPKPHPDVYLAVLVALKADPEQSVAIEDSEPGVCAARRAGLHVVAVPSRLTRRHNHAVAHRVVDSLDILEWPLWPASGEAAA